VSSDSWNRRMLKPLARDFRKAVSAPSPPSPIFAQLGAPFDVDRRDQSKPSAAAQGGAGSSILSAAPCAVMKNAVSCMPVVPTARKD